MDRPIDRIKIEGYKSIRKMDLEMGALNVLIGANGVGKSNFVSAFGFLPQIIFNDLNQVCATAGGASRLLHFGPKQTPNLNIELTFDINTYLCSLIHTDGDSLRWQYETCTFDNHIHPPTTKNICQRGLTSGLVQYSTSEPIAKSVLECMTNWRVFHFHDTGINSPLRQTNLINDNEYFRPDGSNLIAFLYRLSQTHQHCYQLIVETVRQIAPFFHDFNFRPNPLNTNTLLSQWKENSSDAYFDIYSFSDGTLRFICLATLFLQPKELRPTTIIIDEPELGLHPSAIHLLATMLRQAAKTTQVIVATQSVTLVNQLQPEDVIVVDRKDEQSTFQRLSTQDMTEWLDNYGLGDLWEKNVFGGRP